MIASPLVPSMGFLAVLVCVTESRHLHLNSVFLQLECQFYLGMCCRSNFRHGTDGERNKVPDARGEEDSIFYDPEVQGVDVWGGVLEEETQDPMLLVSAIICC